VGFFGYTLTKDGGNYIPDSLVRFATSGFFFIQLYLDTYKAGLVKKSSISYSSPPSPNLGLLKDTLFFFD
jgi:hypothetical protein